MEEELLMCKWCEHESRAVLGLESRDFDPGPDPENQPDDPEAEPKLELG